jgi:hypothetical protein
MAVLCFRPGGTRRKEHGARRQGLPEIFTVRRGARIGKAGTKGDRGRGASQRRASEALRMMGQNQVDIQTAVHDRERYMLYSRQGTFQMRLQVLASTAAIYGGQVDIAILHQLVSALH